MIKSRNLCVCHWQVFDILIAIKYFKRQLFFICKLSLNVHDQDENIISSNGKNEKWDHFHNNKIGRYSSPAKNAGCSKCYFLINIKKFIIRNTPDAKMIMIPPVAREIFMSIGNRRQDEYFPSANMMYTKIKR